MVKIIGHHGAQSLGFTPNTFSAFGEALETAHGFTAPLSRSMDSVVFCIEDVVRDNTDISYNLKAQLSDDSAYHLGDRRLDQVMADEASGFVRKNGGKMPKLQDVCQLARRYPDADFIFKLRGENSAKDTSKTLLDISTHSPNMLKQIVLIGYDPATLQTFRVKFPMIRVCMMLYPETFPKGIKLYPWSIRDFSCYSPFNQGALESPLMKRLEPEIFALELSCLRESTVRNLIRQYNRAKVMLWFDNEVRPEDNFALIQRLRNKVIAPHISHVLTKYPRQMVSVLGKEGIIKPERILENVA